MKVADMHCDTIGRLYGNPGSCLRENEFHLDLKKMVEGDYLLQNFAVFVPLNETENPFETAMEMIDLYYEELEKNRDLIAPVYKFSDLVNHQANGKMGALLTIEEGETLKGNLAFLRNVYRLGVRMIALTWNFDNQIGSPNVLWKQGISDENTRNPKGLKEKGIEMVQEMERLGILVDVSHLSDGGFYDVLRYTRKPFVASHSNAAFLQGVCRNLTDDMIRALGERGGVMGLNYLPHFLVRKEEEDQEGLLLDQMAAHVRHMADVGGLEVCALGSDFDGIPGNPAIPHAGRVQRLAGALKKQGFCESEIEKIFYQNVLRVYRDVLK